MVAIREWAGSYDIHKKLLLVLLMSFKVLLICYYVQELLAFAVYLIKSACADHYVSL